MANLVLSGDTSGSVTLSAPAVAGTTTLTLPTTSSTLATLAAQTFTGTQTMTTLTSPASTALTLQSAGTTAITIDTSQRVIAGYTASVGTGFQTMMQVKGQGSASTYAGYSLTTSNNESAGLFGVYSNGENSLWIASDPDNLRVGSRIVFDVDGTQKAQINPFGIGVGTATPTSGTGIAFPATQSASSDANTLDDYEEGTWTPTIRGSSTIGTATYTTQQGTYTKIGNTVRFQAEIVWTAHTGSGQLEVGNYPFTSTAETSPISLSFSGGPTFTLGSFVQAYKNPSSTTSGTAQTSSTSSFSSISVSNAGTVQVSGVYKVA